MAFLLHSKLSVMLFALALVITLVHAAALDNHQDEPAQRNHWINNLPFLVNSAPDSSSDNAVAEENTFKGKYQHAIVPAPLTSATTTNPAATPATTLQKRAPLPSDVARGIAIPTDSTTYSTYLNCTTTIPVFPTPYQNGPKSTVWISTFTETVYFDCHGCTFVIDWIPSTSTHFHRTTTVSSILTKQTPTCWDPPGAPWLSTSTTSSTSTTPVVVTGY